MRKNPIESAEKFHLGKGRQTWEGRAHKKQLFLSNLFSCPVTHLAFSLSLLRTKLSTIVFTCHIFFPITLPNAQSISARRKTESTTCPLFFSSDNPLVVAGVKRGVHGCQIALKTPWKIDLQHFSGPWHYSGGSWMGNLWAWDGIKMSSLLEKKENCPFSPSPSSPKNRQERKKHRRLRL